MYSETRMRGANSHYRAHPASERGNLSTERIIKICIEAFPSIWVSCITCSELLVTERRLSHSILSVYPYLFLSQCSERLFYALTTLSLTFLTYYSPLSRECV